MKIPKFYDHFFFHAFSYRENNIGCPQISQIHSIFLKKYDLFVKEHLVFCDQPSYL